MDASAAEIVRAMFQESRRGKLVGIRTCDYVETLLRGTNLHHEHLRECLHERSPAAEKVFAGHVIQHHIGLHTDVLDIVACGVAWNCVHGAPGEQSDGDADLGLRSRSP